MRNLYASAVVAQVSYGDSCTSCWGPNDAVGAPQISSDCGDNPNAWTVSREAVNNQLPVWIAPSFAKPLRVTRFGIYETYNVGFVTKVEFVTVQGNTVEVFNGKDNTTSCPGWFYLSFDPSTEYFVDKVVVTVKATSPGSWPEIDAFELRGYEWVVAQPPPPRPPSPRPPTIPV